MQNLEAALAYAKLGWPVFPCRADKRPYTQNGVHDATTNEQKITEWWNQYPHANIGMDVGAAGMMALDFDPGSDMAGIIHTLPPTALQQTTPRGGLHMFYSLPPGERVSASASKFAPHVDVRSSSSYVLLPPSRTKDGIYSWEKSANLDSLGYPTASPSHCTREMIEKCNAGREKHKDNDRWIIEADLPENVASAVAWLRDQARVAVEGEGGDHCTFSTAAMMKSYGISQSLAFDLLWDHWNPRCSPPWDADTLGEKIENGYAYNASPPGNVTRAYRDASFAELFKPVEAKVNNGREVLAKPYRFVDWYRQSEIKPPDWLIDNFLPEGGYYILYGGFGTFKTFMALDIALAVACHGFTTTVTPTRFGGGIGGGPVLFAVSEGRAGIIKRTHAWSNTYFGGGGIKDFILADPVPGVLSNDLDAFINGALQMRPGGYKLVVVDTIGRAMQGANENTQEDASRFTMIVERIQRDLGAAVLALHHVTKMGGMSVKGSTEFSGSADTLIHASREDNEYAVTLTMIKQKDFEQWPAPRVLALKKVGLGEDFSSLVIENSVETPQAEDVPQKASVIMEELDVEHERVLKSNPTKAWNAAELLRMIGATGKFDTKYIRKHSIMARLRETSGTVAHRCYDAVLNRYIWRG